MTDEITQLNQEESQVAKDAIGEAVGEAIRAQKSTIPPWLLAIGIFASVAGSYFKGQADIEYLQKQQYQNCQRIEQIQTKIYTQESLYVRLDERLAGLQKELGEIKILLKEAISQNHK